MASNATDECLLALPKKSKRQAAYEPTQLSPLRTPECETTSANDSEANALSKHANAKLPCVIRSYNRQRSAEKQAVTG